MRIAVLSDAPPAGSELNPYGPIQVKETAESVAEAIKELGHEPVPLKVGIPPVFELTRVRPDLVFNLVSGVECKEKQAVVAGLLEMSGIPFTGSGLRAHVLGLHKDLAKYLFRANGVPTSPFVVIRRPDKIGRVPLKYPLLVKPVHEGSSMGITEDCLVSSRSELARAVKKVITTFNQPALVEEFLPGREFTVGIIGNVEPKVLPLVEAKVGAVGLLYTYEKKSNELVEEICPARVVPELAGAIALAAKDAYRAVGARDFARVDIRLDRNGAPQVLELNTLPGLAPDYSAVPRMARALGMSFTELIDKIIETALLRAGAKEDGNDEGTYRAE